MRNKFSFLLISFAFGGILLLGIQGEAATLEDLKESVEEGKGVVYNPISEGIMTEEGSVEFVNAIENILEESTSEEITDEIKNQAYEETSLASNLETDVPDLPEFPTITSRVATRPGENSYYFLKNGNVYRSNPFTGSGWQYSGFRFRFSNSVENPFFGVRAEGDSFNFRTNQVWSAGNPSYDNGFVVQANAKWIYAPSYSSMGYGPYYGYFSTHNPVNNCRYFIY